MFGVEACGDDTAGETRGEVGDGKVGGDDTAGDGDLETIVGVGDREDTWGMKGMTFDTLGGDAVGENVKDTSGEGLMYEAWTTDPTVLGSGLFCRQ